MVGASVRPPPFGRQDAERLTEELRNLDPRLAVHWHFKRERWWIVEWVDYFQKWTHCFFWEGEAGEFRPLPGSAEPLIIKLRSIDWAQYKDLDRETAHDKIERDMSATRKGWVANRKREGSQAGVEFGRDMGARVAGVRQTFGPGPLRSRKFAESRDTSLDKFWAARLAEHPTRTGVKPQ